MRHPTHYAKTGHIYATEIEQVIRLNHRDVNNKKAGLVLATITRVILCDNILQYKGKLMGDVNFGQLFINTDEPLEVRKAKCLLRKAAYNAKKMGDSLTFKHDQITINDVIYTTSDTEKIPRKYLIADSQQVIEPQKHCINWPTLGFQDKSCLF